MIRTLVSNKLALRNPISVEVHNECLAECFRIVYHIELTDHDASLQEEQFDNWDDLVRFVAEAPELFIEGSGISEFKIWTECVDFSDKL